MKTITKYLSLAITLAASYYGQAQQIELSMQDAMRLAKEQNKTIQLQYMEEKVANEAAREAKSNLLPTIGVSGNYQYYFDRQVIFMPGSFVGNDNQPVVDVEVGGTNAVSANVYLQQVLLNEAARKQSQVARLLATAETQTTRETESELIIRISEKYYTIMLLQRSVDLHRQSAERNQQALYDSRSLYHQGKALKIDTLRNYLSVQNLYSTISYLENKLDVANLELKGLLGVVPETTLVLKDSLYFDEAATQFINLSNEEMLANRPDVQRGLLAIEITKNGVKMERAKRLPTVSLVGLYQVQAQDDDIRFQSWPATSYIGLQANLPLYGGYRTNSRIKQSNWRLKQSQIALKQIHENALTEKASLENELQEAIKQVRIQNKTVDAATINYQMTTERYRNGLSSRLELSDAELALTTARMNGLNAVYRVLMTKLQFEVALGVLKF